VAQTAERMRAAIRSRDCSFEIPHLTELDEAISVHFPWAEGTREEAEANDGEA
jgi:hypothetical protein